MNQPARAFSGFGPCLLTVLLLAAGFIPASGQEGVDSPRRAARTMADAILSGESSKASPLLPRRGRVHVDLPELAPAAGGFLSASQFRYLLSDMARQHRMHTLNLSTPRESGSDGTMVEGELKVTLRGQLKPTLLSLRLVFVRHQGTWLLRDMVEKASPRR